MEDGSVAAVVRRGARCASLLLLAAVLGLCVALPVFAQDGEPTQEEGGTLTPQVVGGEPVPTGKFPFMVSIQANTSGASPYREHFCGGTLIDADSVLTAAHCADFIGVATTAETLDYRDVRLAIGVTKLNSSQGVARRISRLSDVEIHPLYNRRNHYDAAVIDFDNPVGITPIALASPDSGNTLEQPGDFATVAGWGNTIQQSSDYHEPDRFPQRMRRAQVPIVSDTRAAGVYTGYVPDIMVAAGKRGVDTCQGDSGGPMWANTDAGRQQIGITSFGVGCGARGFPGVYAEVNNQSISSFIEVASSN